MYDPRENNIELFNKDKLDEIAGFNVGEEKAKIEREINQLIDNPKDSPYVQLQKWRKLGIKLFKFFEANSEITKVSIRTKEEVYARSEANKNKKWSKEEDELLIDKCCEDLSLMELANIFGRTPSAIKTRISSLVGMKRISSKIAGRFIGEINGNHIEGQIKGVLNK